MNDAPSTVGLIIFLTALGLLPFFIVTMTAFLKISVVMFILRNATGLQQTPPTLVLYSIALILTVYVSLPLMEDVSNRLAANPLDFSSLDKLQSSANVVKDPVKAHLMRYAKPAEREFFLSATARIWPPNHPAPMSRTMTSSFCCRLSSARSSLARSRSASCSFCRS